MAASIEGRLRQVAGLLLADPGIAERSLAAAAVLGDTNSVRARLVADAEAALAVDDERGWPPLLYACYSRWHHIDSGRAVGLAQVVKLLLDVGASPHTNNGAFRDGYRSALRGAVEVNNPRVVEVLLEAGANPDDGRCIEQAADRRDPRCLELLLARRARVAGTWALGAAVYADASEAVSRLLDALLIETGQTASEATNALADAAAANAGYAVVDALLGAGADPNVTDSDVGHSAVRCAMRAGHQETGALLVRRGAADDSTNVDRFIGACLAGHRQGAEDLLAEHPELREQMTDEDWSVIVDAAGSRPAETIAFLLDLGFSPHTRNGFGEQPLHNAAYHGNASVVQALLDAGADVDGRDDRFEATPLAYATVGSGEQAGKPGDWSETVRLLVEAGASKDGVWISDKPPSEEIMESLAQVRHHPRRARRRPARGRRDGPDGTARLDRQRSDGRRRPAPRGRLPRGRSRVARIAVAPRGHLDGTLSQQGAGPRLVPRVPSRWNRRHRAKRRGRP